MHNVYFGTRQRKKKHRSRIHVVDFRATNECDATSFHFPNNVKDTTVDVPSSCHVPNQRLSARKFLRSFTSWECYRRCSIAAHSDARRSDHRSKTRDLSSICKQHKKHFESDESVHRRFNTHSRNRYDRLLLCAFVHPSIHALSYPKADE